MKTGVLRRFFGIVLIAALCVSLLGCGKGSYDDGYEAGFAAALEAAVAEAEAVETVIAETGPAETRAVETKAGVKRSP